MRPGQAFATSFIESGRREPSPCARLGATHHSIQLASRSCVSRPNSCQLTLLEASSATSRTAYLVLLACITAALHVGALSTLTLLPHSTTPTFFALSRHRAYSAFTRFPHA